MKNKVFYWLFGMILLSGGCMESSDQVWVSKVKDLKKIDEAVWHLEYDNNGRLVKYGRTPIEYDTHEIRIGRMDWDYRGEQLLSATYYLSGENVYRSDARCLVITDSMNIEVEKEVDYEFCGDTIKTAVTYFSIPNHRLIRQVLAQYVYNEAGNLIEVISRYTDSKRSTSACHSYYYYDKNVSCISNLNMLSFFVHTEGPDAFFFLLLHLDRKSQIQKLPTYIRYCVNHGKEVYIAEGLYRLEDDLLVHGEVISNEVKLKSRLDFEYAE